MNTLLDEILLMGMEAETYASEVFRVVHARLPDESDALSKTRQLLRELTGEQLIEMWAADPLNLGTRVEVDGSVGDLLARSDWLLGTVGEDGLSLVYETTTKGEVVVRRNLNWADPGGDPS